MSARLKLTLSYAGAFGMAGALIVAAGWALVLLRKFFPQIDSLLHAMIPSQYRQFLLDFLVPGSVVVIIALLAIGLLVGWFVAGRMLAPLTRIGEVARLASQGSLEHRVSLKGRQDEFSELADVFDSMLDRVQAQIAEQQRFAANASHELRTPLAITQTLLEVARTDPDRDVDALLARLAEVNSRAIELTEALLQLSKADQRAFSRSVVDLSLIAEETAETLLPLAERRGVVLAVDGDSASAIGSSALLQQLAANLVHNAIVHNIPAGSVWIRTQELPDAAVLTVENTGALLTPQLLGTIAEPFQRTDRSRSGDHVGAGLGLPIAQRIVEAHDGHLDLTPRTGGGLVVVVRLPLGPSGALAAARP